ncbi:MAG: hypothetical protein A3J69_02970 [Candidatus Levybacteria bacterium RIFCSPHIGHO2_02_FULL_42_12]|nr:MAG: hypothetical protein A2698_01490 [Candidatus Levybacteria bacterium RIFCSPHIGHO2_01_FULL_42_15]OGH33302.1 MAG: hypothetical protein A3J69_02970 [Candidatus Levybacteria bacterium RIFCSPHIGHO2_02_FULL_42_12]
MKIDGREIARSLFKTLSEHVLTLNNKGVIPHLAIIIIGNDPSSYAYVAQKEKKARNIGIKVTVIRLESMVESYRLRNIIQALNRNPTIHGIIVQRPLPLHIDRELINELVHPSKDVDAFHSKTKFEFPISKATIVILEHIYSSLKTLKKTKEIKFVQWLASQAIVVVGKGETGGKPIATTLKKLGIKPLIVDSKTKNPKLIIEKADILISTVGKPNMIKPAMLKKNTILIGVGIHKGKDGKLHADYNEKKIKDRVSFYTGVPGGVGPVNVAMLLDNLVLAALSR